MANPYVLLPTYTPVHGERLPDELKSLISEYQDASLFVLTKLIDHGGFEKSYIDKDKKQVKSLSFQNGCNTYAMTIRRERFVDYNGMKVDIPYITSHQYICLYRSMLRPGYATTADINATLHGIFEKLLLAIEHRATLHDWHLQLPATDPRVVNNPRHAAFLQCLRNLRDAIARRLF